MGWEWSRLRRGEWIVGAGGVALLASMLLLPWYRVAGMSVDGWHGLTHLRWLLLATVAAAFALVYFQATRPAPAIPVTLSLLVTVLGVIAALWLIYRDFISAAGSLEAGAIIGLLALIAIAAGGWESQHREGIAPGDVPEIPTVSLDETGHGASGAAKPSGTGRS